MEALSERPVRAPRQSGLSESYRQKKPLAKDFCLQNELLGFLRPLVKIS